jgi:DNA polymerase-3 subunit alpha
VMDNYAKKLSIQLNIKDIQTEKINNLKELIRMHPGNQILNFVIYDHEESIKLNMPSRKKKVKISQELLQELENQEVYYKLN